jgi:hypothetical protein
MLKTAGSLGGPRTAQTGACLCMHDCGGRWRAIESAFGKVGKVGIDSRSLPGAMYMPPSPRTARRVADGFRVGTLRSRSPLGRPEISIQ